MPFLEAVDVYFRGEKHTGFALIPLGLVMLGVGIYFTRWYGGGLGKGLGIPLALAGVLAAAGAGFLIKTVNDRQAALTTAYAAQPAAPIDAEVTRMKKVGANWPVLKGTWAALSVVALALLLLVPKDWVHGIALALLCFCALAMVIDVFAEARADVYTARIEAALDE